MLLPPLTRSRRFVTVGLMPPDARAAIGLEWTPGQERTPRHFCGVLGLVEPVLPERLRAPLTRRAIAPCRTGVDRGTFRTR
ncbi:uncharacterized protein (DUF2236 family) [Streptomyces fulvorobeus]|uniref:Uncharacterized protein (DUF2236 family) n=1 Tax=Streptomyces fulvorobeus TaxID=284028 RepID=A0A7Y9KW91_9ACTN|nr:uncharacterized protein (DUF2236 family) [Streptomyces fulvorobeus]